MDRLTHERANGIKTGYWSSAKKEDLIQRLAAYEDTGLEPEEIMDGRLLTGWIPVSERLPKTEGTYQVYICTLDGEFCGQAEPFAGMCGFEDGKWDEEGDVIAWMPLPEVYKGE